MGRACATSPSAAGALPPSGTLGSAAAAETVDASGLHILPGVIDTQVHFREPGLEHKEDLETGSRAAVLGGVTAVFEMPNTKPLTTTAAALADKVTRARNRMFCDFAFYVGGTRENVGDIPALERLEGSAGIKVFMGSSTGDLLVDDEACSCTNRREPEPPRRLPRRGRSAPQGAHGPAPPRRSVIASRVARRASRAHRDRASRRTRRAATKSACTFCTSRPPTRWRSLPTTRAGQASR